MPNARQPESFVLIPGRTSRQGTTLSDTHGTGMPNSKSFDMELERVE